MNVLACQIEIPGIRSAADKSEHLQRLSDRISAECGRAGSVDLVVLPEMSSMGYTLFSLANLQVLAEDIEGESFRVFSALAQKHACCIAYGFPRRENDRLYVCHAVAGPDGGLLAFYDKLHLAQFGAAREKDYFSAGNRLCLFDAGGLRTGIVICYDFRFPGLTHRLVHEHGCDFIIHPVGFTRDITFASWHHFVICRALENQVFFLSLNWAGAQWGCSLFCPPWIDEQRSPACFGTDEQFRLLHLDPAELEAARARIPLREDKRIDFDSIF